VLLKAARASGRKDKCQLRLTGIEQEYWMGTEISRLEGYSFQGTVNVVDGSIQKGGKMGAGYVNLRVEKKAAEEGGTRCGRIQLELSGISGFFLGVMRHPFDKTHALCVRQPSAAEGCGKIGGRRRQSDVERSTRRRHFTGSNRTAPKKNNRRARDLTNLGYPQVPSSIPAENPSTQINIDLSK